MGRTKTEERLDQPPSERHHLVARIRRALAEDPRVGELGVTVSLTEEAVILSGRVATEERRRAAAAVAAELAPGLAVKNQIDLEDVRDAPSDPEPV